MFTSSDIRHVTRMVLGLALTCLVPSAAHEGFAQPANPSRWGVSFSVTPAWETAESVKKLIAEEGETVDINGREFTIGFVRGSRRGGDWGVSFVRKPFDDGLASSSSNTNCFTPPNQTQICLRSDEKHYFENVGLNGVEAHWFIPFARIKDRVQIGANVGGGIAKVIGSVRTVEDHEEPVFTPGPGGGTIRVVTEHTEETAPAEEELLPVFPLLKLEVEGAVIATPALKIKVAGGLNFPSVSVRVLAVYFFGAR